MKDDIHKPVDYYLAMFNPDSPENKKSHGFSVEELNKAFDEHHMPKIMNLLNDKHSYRVPWSDEDQEYVGLCTEFPSLSYLSHNPLDAFNGIRKLVNNELNQEVR